MERLTKKSLKYNTYEIQDNCNQDIYNKLGKLEDFIEEIDSATIIYKDGIASFHIDMILTKDTLPIVKKYFNCKEIDRDGYEKK